MDDAASRTPPALGVAFGGGTARGLAHIGALAALEEADLRPRAVAGTSLGALLAALYALGSPPGALEHLVRTQSMVELWSQALDFGLHRGALVHGRRLQRWLDRKVFFGATFADLEMPLAVSCCDVQTGRPVVLREGNLAEAVYASCALPGIFAPSRHGGRALVDGGFLETVPFAALAALGPTRMIGLHAGVDVGRAPLVLGLRRWSASRSGRRFHARARRLEGRRPMGQLGRGVSLVLRGYAKGIHVPPGATLVRLEPPVAWWDFHRSPEAIDAGLRAMRGALDAGLREELAAFADGPGGERVRP